MRNLRDERPDEKTHEKGRETNSGASPGSGAYGRGTGEKERAEPGVHQAARSRRSDQHHRGSTPADRPSTRRNCRVRTGGLVELHHELLLESLGDQAQRGQHTIVSLASDEPGYGGFRDARHALKMVKTLVLLSDQVSDLMPQRGCEKF